MWQGRWRLRCCQLPLWQPVLARLPGRTQLLWWEQLRPCHRVPHVPELLAGQPALDPVTQLVWEREKLWEPVRLLEKPWEPEGMLLTMCVTSSGSSGLRCWETFYHRSLRHLPSCTQREWDLQLRLPASLADQPSSLGTCWRTGYLWPLPSWRHTVGPA